MRRKSRSLVTSWEMKWYIFVHCFKAEFQLTSHNFNENWRRSHDPTSTSESDIRTIVFKFAKKIGVTLDVRDIEFIWKIILKYIGRREDVLIVIYRELAVLNARRHPTMQVRVFSGSWFWIWQNQLSFGQSHLAELSL